MGSEVTIRGTPTFRIRAAGGTEVDELKTVTSSYGGSTAAGS